VQAASFFRNGVVSSWPLLEHAGIVNTQILWLKVLGCVDALLGMLAAHVCANAGKDACGGVVVNQRGHLLITMRTLDLLVMKGTSL
jgi:hypothetical protein